MVILVSEVFLLEKNLSISLIEVKCRPTHVRVAVKVLGYLQIIMKQFNKHRSNIPRAFLKAARASAPLACYVSILMSSKHLKSA